MPAPTFELLAEEGERAGEGQDMGRSHSFLSGGKCCKPNEYWVAGRGGSEERELVLVPAPTFELLAEEGERAGQGQESHSFLSGGKCCKHLGVGWKEEEV